MYALNSKYGKSGYAKPLVESLDSRQLMSSASLSSTGVLTVVGSSADDTIVIEKTTLTVSSGVAAFIGDAVGVTINGVASKFWLGSVSKIVAYGLDGDDVISTWDSGRGMLAIPMYVQGGEGDDVLVGGNQRDSLFGNDGEDELFGRDNADSLCGGADDDVIWGDDGTDYLLGGGGADELNGGDANDTMIR